MFSSHTFKHHLFSNSEMYQFIRRICYPSFFCFFKMEVTPLKAEKKEKKPNMPPMVVIGDRYTVACEYIELL